MDGWSRHHVGQIQLWLVCVMDDAENSAMVPGPHCISDIPGMMGHVQKTLAPEMPTVSRETEGKPSTPGASLIKQGFG